MSGPKSKTFSKSVDLEALSVTLETPNNRKTFELALVPPVLHNPLLLHGLSQKLSDAAALPAGSTETDKWEAIDALWAALLSGEWSLKREGAGTLLLRALCEVYPNRDRESLRTWLDGRSAAEKSALERNAKVRPVLERLRAAKGEGVDSDALLTELEA